MTRSLILASLLMTVAVHAQLGTSPADAAAKVLAAELHAALAKGDAVVIDVRGSVPFDLEHIPGAISLPLGLVAARADELSKEKLVVAYCTCKAEELSGEAVIALEKAGFPRVAALRGGLAAWKEAGFPVTKTEEVEVPFAAATPVAAGRTRMAPPVGLPCDRNDLTSFSGAVSSYSRKKKPTRIILATDDGTTETFKFPSVKREELQKHFMIDGGRFMAPDWSRIEEKEGVLAPGTRAVVWVCSAPKHSVIVDWRPAEGR